MNMGSGEAYDGDDRLPWLETVDEDYDDGLVGGGGKRVAARARRPGGQQRRRPHERPVMVDVIPEIVSHGAFAYLP